MQGTGRGTVAIGFGVVNPGRREAADGSLANQVVDTVVDVEGEGGKEDEAANVKVAEGATLGHELVFVKGVERSAEGGDVEGSTDK